MHSALPGVCHRSASARILHEFLSTLRELDARVKQPQQRPLVIRIDMLERRCRSCEKDVAARPLVRNSVVAELFHWTAVQRRLSKSGPQRTFSPLDWHLIAKLQQPSARAKQHKLSTAMLLEHLLTTYSGRAHKMSPVCKSCSLLCSRHRTDRQLQPLGLRSGRRRWRARRGAGAGPMSKPLLRLQGRSGSSMDHIAGSKPTGFVWCCCKPSKTNVPSCWRAVPGLLH